MNGLQNIIKKIEEDAKLQCEEILEAAKLEAESIKAEYAEMTADSESDIAAKFEKEAEAMITRAKSSSAMTKRNIVSGQRSENVALAYKNALDFLYSLPRERYAQLLMDLAVSAIKNHAAAAASKEAMYGETSGNVSYELVLNERDREELGEYCVFTIKNNYKKELGSDVLRRFTLAPDTAKIDGGVIVRAGSVEENCSLSLMIEDMRTKLDPVIYKTLYPEA